MIIKSQPINHFIHGLSARRKSPAVQPTNLQTAPQTLGGGIVPAVTLAAHGRTHFVAFERLLEVMPAILASPIRVEDQPRLRAAPKPCNAQRIDHYAGLHVLAHAPPHHLSAEQVNDSRQVQPGFTQPDFGPDYAKETTNLAKSQIIAQAATAILALANQSGQSVLALLK